MLSAGIAQALQQPGPSVWQQRVARAAECRLPLFETTDALRLFDANVDGASERSSARLHVELFGEYAVLSPFSEEALRECDAVAKALVDFGVRGVYLKHRVRGDLRRLDQRLLAADEPLLGSAAPEAIVVRENGRSYHVNLSDGLSVGLFLDQRDNRSRLQADAAGQRVLNLFAYTCSFSVAAGLGGAAGVTSVDLSKRALRRGDANLKLNQLDTAAHRLLKADAVQWLSRAAKRGPQFDWIVLDPPSFSSRGKSAFSVSRDYPKLLEQCLVLLEPGGRLLCITNHRRTSRHDFEHWCFVAAGTTGRKVRSEWMTPPVDCPQDNGDDSSTKALLVELVA